MDLVPAYLFLGVDSSIRCINFASRRSKEFMVAGSCAGDLSIWDMETMRVKYMKKAAHSEMVLGVSVVSTKLEDDGEEDDVQALFLSVVSHGKDGHLVWWDVSVGGIWTKKCVAPCLEMNFCKSSFCEYSPSNIHPSPIHLAITPNSTPQNGVCTDLFLIHQHDISLLTSFEIKFEQSGLILDTVLQQHRDDVIVVTAHDGGAVVVQVLGMLLEEAGKGSNEWKGWSVRRKGVVCSKQAKESIMAVDYCTGKGVSGSAGGSVVLWRLEGVVDDVEMRVVEVNKMKLGVGVSVVKIRGDGKVVAVGDFEGRVHLMGGSSLKYLACITYHTGSLFDACFVPSNNHLAICSDSQTISFWDLYS